MFGTKREIQNKEMPEIGQMDHRVELLNPSIANNDLNNQEIVTLVSIGTVWAQRIVQTNSEKVMLDERTAVIKEIFVIRYNQNVNQETTVRFEGDDFNIESIKVLGRKEFMKLNCMDHQ